MQSMSVRPGQLEQLAGTITKNSGDIRGALDTLDSAVASLIGSWEGSAQESYHSAQRTWDTKITEMNQLLSDIARTTSQIGSNYSQTDSQQARNFT